MWLYLAALLGLYFLRQWYLARQTVENLTEKYVFITGCDSGFGNLLARQLDARGLRVLAACLTQKGAKQLGKATSERLRTTILDVTSTENIEAATEWVNGCVGGKGLWGLVNNAGIATPVVPNEWLTKDDFAKVINVNLLGLIDVTLHMLPLVKKARGRVVNVSSVFGRAAVFGGGYGPSKFGVEAFSDSLRRELHPFGVRVSIIEPGAFHTAILNSVIEDLQKAWSRVPSDINESYGQEYFEKCEFKEQVLSINSNLYMVTDCMEHALKSVRPRTRYSVGWDAVFFYIPLSYLPSWVSDIFIRRFHPRPAEAV
ncbi:17-beta-hydroxysteroid dehydrogenase type 6-like isoform X2 [Tiliqua scincoides]|uniref:17-beta-hydroxysteroid dehydrogenase type 6-like isoform X2 n=1 Tax=Tiliqua scincoides TaxID=71010 RepID=UPI0034637077